MRVKPSARLTLKDKLSRLAFVQATKLLGPNGAQWLAKGGAIEIDLSTQVRFTDECFRVTFIDSDAKDEPLVVSVALDDSYRDRLRIACSGSGDKALLHKAATLSLILEEKTALGLAGAPDEDTPWELLPEGALESRALAERAQRASEEKMTIKSTESTKPWADYMVTSALSGKTYRVALRGLERGQSYCSCPDFRKNLLGVCKHVFKVQAWVKKKFSASDLARKWIADRFAVFARYDGDLRLSVEAPIRISSAARQIVEPWRNRFARDGPELVKLIETVRKLSQLGEEVIVYPDAEEILDQTLHRHRMSVLVTQIRKNPGAHPLRRQLLKTELLPYQLDGIAFAVGAGRAVLADEMGLGKTIQGVGVAELLARADGHRARAHRLSRFAQVAVARGDPALLRTQRAARRPGRLPSAPHSIPAAHSSPCATTSRCCATSSPSSARSGTSSSSTKRSGSRTGRRRPAASSNACARPSPWCSPARRSRIGSTICFPWSSSSTIAGSAPRIASSTATAWQAIPARCWATRISMRCASA